MDWLIAFIPTILFAINPTIVNKVGAKGFKQQLGTMIGAVIFAIVVFFITFSTSIKDLSNGNPSIYYIPLFSGFFWSFGQFFQYQVLIYLGTTLGFPLCAGLNIIFNGLVSFFIFHEWQTTNTILLGFFGILTILIGCILTTYVDKSKKSEIDKKKFLLGFISLIISAIFLTIYAAVPKFVTMDGISSSSTLLPQAIGIIIGTIIVTLIMHFKEVKEHKVNNQNEVTKIWDKQLLFSIIPGLLWGAANLALIYAESTLGLAIGFTLSQMCAPLSTFISLVLLKEYKQKTHKELIFVVLGNVIIVAGCITVGFTM